MILLVELGRLDVRQSFLDFRIGDGVKGDK